MDLHGKNLVAGEWMDGWGDTTFQATNPANGQKLEPAFLEASSAQADTAISEACDAFQILRTTTPEQRAGFLETLATSLEAKADTILQRAEQETALGKARLHLEFARTVAQPRLFAELIREGSWVDAKIDRADPNRKPLPRPSMRSMLQPIGPIAVFGASNFPLAISVLGTDTVCAFAAGCPVIIKAHPAHPGTCETTAEAIVEALNRHSLPLGSFSLLHGTSHEIGQAIVRHPGLAAVAFTGSLKGGRALMYVAARRETPIPVFAEMGSMNPVFLLPEALCEKAESIAEGFIASLTTGGGQFCTNPGIMLALDSPELDSFLNLVSQRVESAVPATMLHAGIHDNYNAVLDSFCRTPGVHVRAKSATSASAERLEAAIFLLETDYATWQANPGIRQECFGPASILIRVKNLEEFHAFTRNMEGSLTATLHGTPTDLEANSSLCAILETRVGRLVYNGFPTGVEIGHATHHGGPYPATSTGTHTSIGIGSIHRFVRPICYQNCPDDQLPPELRDANPLGILRRIDGQSSKESVHG